MLVTIVPAQVSIPASGLPPSPCLPILTSVVAYSLDVSQSDWGEILVVKDAVIENLCQKLGDCVSVSLFGSLFHFISLLCMSDFVPVPTLLLLMAL